MLINDVKDIDLNSYDKLVFWVGAGISSNEPTCLPLGNKLTELVLRSGLDSDYDDFINKYKESMLIITDKGAFPRLETIFQIYKDIDDNEHCNFMNVLKLFSKPHYNENHMLLAYQSHNNNITLTSNFDDCIEKAYKDMYCEDDCSVIHFHGKYNELDNIGITIENITDIRDDIKSKFKSTIEGRNLHIFVGYSLSDDLDVNPYLKEKKKTNSDALFIIHSTSNDIRLNKDKLAILENSFKSVYEYKIDTNEFLRKISGCKFNINSLDKFSFEDEYKTLLKTITIDKNAFRVHLSMFIGIIPNGIDCSYKPKHENTKKILSQVLSALSIAFDENGHNIRLAKFKNEPNDIWNLNRLSWDYYIKRCNNDLSEMDYKYIAKIIRTSDNLLDKDIAFLEKCTLLRFRGVLNAILGNYTAGFKSIKEAMNNFELVSYLDGIIGCYIDLYFCDKISDKDQKEVRFLEKTDNKKLDYIRKLIKEKKILPKHGANLEYFANHIK